MNVNSADCILLGYVAARERLSSAPGLHMTLHEGTVVALFCAETRNCSGTPREHIDGWKCSACQKRWRMDRVELGRTQIGGRVTAWGRELRVRRMRVAPRSPETRHYGVLRDFGPVLEQVVAEDPHAAWAWHAHLLHDEGIRLGWLDEAGIRRPATSLGAPLDQIPRLMAEMVTGGLLPALPHACTAYRVRAWIGMARRRTLEIYEERVRNTLAWVNA